MDPARHTYGTHFFEGVHVKHTNLMFYYEGVHYTSRMNGHLTPAQIELEEERFLERRHGRARW